MSQELNDKLLIETICGSLKQYVEHEYKVVCDKEETFEFNHPLDSDVIKRLNDLKPSGSTIEYARFDDFDTLWLMLLEKSIQCLRIFDRREPFRKNPKKRAIAYGLDQLKDYHDKYTEFEGLMYGSNPYYRDHVFHVVRTWMLGVYLLLHEQEGGSGARLVKDMRIDGEPKSEWAEKLNVFEKVSMWTIVALCHDLGYPLEKAEDVLGKTRGMMAMFVPSPNIWSNFSYSGTQDNINEYIVRFISTKLIEVKKADNGAQEIIGANGDSARETESDCIYNGRIQTKYYLKYAKSLERFKHGMISSIIIYKNLLYFMESDFNLNDDRIYSCEDARQFYIRREILRAISAHTCSDVYNLSLVTFSSLLYICDELQEWGRKNWMNLYTGAPENDIQLELTSFSKTAISYKETISLGKASKDTIMTVLQRIYERQYCAYRMKFRDGQHTSDASYEIQKTAIITVSYPEKGNKKLSIKFTIGGNHSFVIDGTDLLEGLDSVGNEFQKMIQEGSDLYKDEITVES